MVVRGNVNAVGAAAHHHHTKQFSEGLLEEMD